MSERPLQSGAERGAARRGLALHWQILIGLVIGAAAGLIAGAALPRTAEGAVNPTLLWIAKNIAEPVGQIFLRLIFMVVIPLVFSALVLGVAGVGDLRRLGRIGGYTLLMTVVLSAISVAIALGLTNTVQPGSRLAPEQRAALREQYAAGAAGPIEQARKAKPVRDVLLDIIPRNPLQEAVGALDGSSPGGGMLAVMFFALVVGVTIALAPDKARPLTEVLEAIYDVCLRIVGFAMRLAPIGVAGLVFALAALLGFDILRTLAWYVVTVIAGLALHLFGVFSLVAALLARMRPREFFRKTSDALVTSFATSSSNATLPTSLRVAEENLRLRPDVARFVLTVGSTANQNGTALYEGVTVLFLAQVFGIELTLAQQAVVALLCILGGIGTAGVPGGSLPLVVLVLQTVGIPAEGIGIILGVDRVLDMCRTTVNVTGDLAIAASVNRLA